MQLIESARGEAQQSHIGPPAWTMGVIYELALMVAASGEHGNFDYRLGLVCDLLRATAKGIQANLHEGSGEPSSTNAEADALIARIFGRAAL